MNYKEFLDYIKNSIADYFGNNAEISIETVLKNNNVRLDGLIILEKGRNLTPTIYLNGYFRQYQNEVGLDEIVEQILEVYENNCNKSKMDFSDILDYGKIKDNIIFKLINRNENEELLRNVPHSDVLDLAKCYGVFIRDKQLKNGMMLIHNSHLSMWNITVEELESAAMRNTPFLLEPCFDPIELVVNHILNNGEDDHEFTGQAAGDAEECGMYVLTNKEKYMGAACMFYEGMMAQLAERLGGSLYILPSSVHEVLVVPKHLGITKWELMSMVKAVNDSEVSREEILSYLVYEYDRINDIIRI